MLTRFSGQMIGSTISKQQTPHYNEEFELLAEQFAEVLAEGDHPLADLTLDSFLSRFPIGMVEPILEEDLSNWVQARKRMRDIRASTQERALRWYGMTLSEYRREAVASRTIRKDGYQ